MGIRKGGREETTEPCFGKVESRRRPTKDDDAILNEGIKTKNAAQSLRRQELRPEQKEEDCWETIGLSGFIVSAQECRLASLATCPLWRKFSYVLGSSS